LPWPRQWKARRRKTLLRVPDPQARWIVEDLLIFSRQMYTLNKAGVPILRAFAGLEASATKPAMVELLKDVRSSLDQGRELSAALARHQRALR